VQRRAVGTVEQLGGSCRPSQGFPPLLDHRGAPRVRRFGEQRWLVAHLMLVDRHAQRSYAQSKPILRNSSADCGAYSSGDDRRQVL